ncbi:hypothetical protein Tco_1084633 [Tanacetum coccineum]
MSASNQQTLAESGASERPPMLEKESYVAWASCFIRHSRLADEFDKFVVVEGESLSFVYERLTTLVTFMDRNEIRRLSISINTKFLNSLQPEWRKYVTMTRPQDFPSDNATDADITKIPIEQTYFSTPSTSNVPSESSIEMSDLPLKKMPSENKLLQLFVKFDNSISDLQTKIDQTLLKDRSRALVFDDQDVLRQFYKTGTYAYADVRAENQDLLMTNFELKAKLKLAEMEVNTKFDKSATLEKLVCVTPLNKNKDLKAKIVSKVEIKTDRSKPVTSRSTSKNEHSQKHYANEIARCMYRITKTKRKMSVDKTNKFPCNSTRLASSSSVSRSNSKDTNSKKRVLLNTKSKRTSKDVKKLQSSFSLVANKNETMNSNVSDSKTNVLNARTVDAYFL